MNTLTTRATITTNDLDNPTRNVWHETQREAQDADNDGWAKRHCQAATQTFQQQGSGDGPITVGKTTYARASGGGLHEIDVDLTEAHPDGCMEAHRYAITDAFAIVAPTT